MVAGFTWLLACQLVGEVVVRATGAPVPGPVVGMVVLLVVLQLRRDRIAEDAGVLRAADGLARHLQLLFVPAGVGVVAHLGLLREHAWSIGVAVVGSWLLGLAAVGWTATLLTRRGPVD